MTSILATMAVNDEVIAAIEKEMKKSVKKARRFTDGKISKAEALEMFKGDRVQAGSDRRTGRWKHHRIRSGRFHRPVPRTSRREY